MKSINRNVVIIKPRKPFLDWLAKLPDPDTEITLEYLRTDCITVLIPECDDENDILGLSETISMRFLRPISCLGTRLWRTGHKKELLPNSKNGSTSSWPVSSNGVKLRHKV